MSIGNTHAPIETNDGNPASTPQVPPSAAPDGGSHWISPPSPSTGLLLFIIAGLAAAIWNLNSKLNRLEGQLANIPKVNEPRIRREITGIVQRLSGLEAEKTSAETEVVNNAKPDNTVEIEDLQSKVSSLDERMSVAEATIDKHRREIADLQQKTRTLNESIVSVKARIAKPLAATTSPRVNAGVKNAPPQVFRCQYWPW